jgi:pimeloyl-ACP methyl ester carboxylesterase
MKINGRYFYEIWVSVMQRFKALDRTRQVFVLSLILVTSSILIAYAVQTDFGRIDIRYISIVNEEGFTVTGKLYKPVTATVENPASGVLLLHGMNNDKDTEGPAALELARRGIVALALDEMGHGNSDSGGALLEALSGQTTLGANASYQYLKQFTFVDASSTGLIGHSMGASVASAVAGMNPDHRAIVIQADGPYNLSLYPFFNNYLAVWAYYEELFETRDRASFYADSMVQIAQNEGLTSPDDASEDYTYGDFTNGTAHRYALCPCTHPGSTWNAKGVAETCAWMLQALDGVAANEAYSLSAIPTQTYMIRECATLFALIVAVLSIIPLAFILMEHPYFSIIKTPKPECVVNKGKEWWKVAIGNALIGGITFLFLPFIGLFGGALLGMVIPIFLLAVANGSLLWLLVNAIIAWYVFKRWFKKMNENEGLTLSDVGAFENVEGDTNREILKRTVILTMILFSYLYALVALSQSYLAIEFRYMWPQLKMFTPARFIQFLIYLIPVLPFFTFNGGVILFGLLRQEEYDSPLKTQMIWWIKNVIAMEGVLLLAILIQYVPMFLFGTGPLLSLGGFFGLYGIFLMAVLPFFAGIFFIMTAFYIKTGRIYLGSFVGTVLVVWVMAVGSLIM